jgi:RNA polymerase sigma factor (sigma-70 family)
MPARPTAALARLAHPDPAGVPDAELLRRFADTRDEAAFELLVWRYAGLVLGTCRRTLARPTDADDAFQATFLALARKAGAVRAGAALGGWLHTVAVRAALRIRAASARRTEAPLPDDLAAPAVTAPDDTARVLDEEIARLPHKLRMAFVLCELEGRTDAEAAAHLGCPKGTVQSRLSRARERLRARLTSRGLAPAVGAAAVPLTVSPALVAATVRAAGPFAAGLPAEGAAVPAAVAAGVLRAMAGDVLKRAGVAIALLAAFAGAAVAMRPAAPQEPPPPAPRVAAPQPAPPPRPAPPGARLATAKHGPKFVDTAQFTLDGKWIITSGASPRADGKFDQVAMAWEAATGRHAHTFAKSDGGVTYNMNLSPDGKFLALTEVGPGGGWVSLWTVGMWQKVWAVEHDFVNEASFSPDGKALVTSVSFHSEGGRGINTVVRDVATGKKRFSPTVGPEERLRYVLFAPDGRLALAVNTGVVRFLDPVTGKPRGELNAPKHPDLMFTFAPDGKRALTWVWEALPPGPAPAPLGAHLWDVGAGKVERVLAKDDPISIAWFSDDGARVHTASFATKTYPGNATGKVVPQIESPATGARLRVWDAATGKAVSEVKPSARDAMLNALSRDGKLVAFDWREGNDSRLVCALFDLGTGKEVARLPGVRRLYFSPDSASALVVRETLLANGDPDADEVEIRPVVELLKFKPPEKK